MLGNRNLELAVLKACQFAATDSEPANQVLLQNFERRHNLRRLAYALHAYHQVNQHLPASQNTTDGSFRYSRVLTDSPDGLIVHVAEEQNSVAVNLGTEDNVRVGQRFIVFDNSAKRFRRGGGKALVEAVKIHDDHLLEARVIRSSDEPITNRDFVISLMEMPASAIVIVGFIDLDGDGKSDMQRLISIIEKMDIGEVAAYHETDGSIVGKISSDVKHLIVGEPPSGKARKAFADMMRGQSEFRPKLWRVQAFLNEAGYRNEARVKRFVEEGTDESGGEKTHRDIFPYSWRVAILPWLGHQKLYDEYRFTERWDSDHNSKLVEQMPGVFRYPGDPEDTWKTRYIGISGPAGPIGVKQGITLEQMSDGTSNTIMLVEARKAIPWTQPEDIYFDPDDPSQPKHQWLLDGICNVAFADATVRSMNVVEAREFPGSKVLAGLFSHSGGENLGPHNVEIFDRKNEGWIETD